VYYKIILIRNDCVVKLEFQLALLYKILKFWCDLQCVIFVKIELHMLKDGMRY